MKASTQKLKWTIWPVSAQGPFGPMSEVYGTITSKRKIPFTSEETKDNCHSMYDLGVSYTIPTNDSREDSGFRDFIRWSLVLGEGIVNP